ncbi:MAG: sodium:solute symporter family protein [Peptococcaceae bacterium]|nr:sodium:solute symporter family protein [Peptococcaceae bacterium]MDH7523896.1 sodium:solute symporter family protein [Peptococcaceae bacterium]
MTIQLLIILGYFVLTVFIGLMARGKSTSAGSFHGAGLGVLMCVAAGTGEWLGGTSTTGVSEYGYMFGLSGAWYTIANGIGIVFLAVLFAKLYRSLETVTIPGIIEKYIGVEARVVSSILLTFVMIAVGTAQVIAAGTLGVTVLGLRYETAVVVLGLGFIIYTLAGGMNAVGYTNIMHLMAMYGGVILAIVLVGTGSGGIGGLVAALPTEPYFNWFSIGKAKVASWVIASILGACTAQAGIQPILAARDVNVARKAAFITALAVAPFGILTALLGMAAKAQFPQLANAKLALPVLMMNLQPVAGGIVLASIMAAILSTVSPIILASGTMITKDIYQRIIKPAATDRELLFVSRLMTGMAGAVCIFLAVFLYGGARILDMVYFAYTIRGSLFVVLLLGIYWRRTTPKGALWAMIVTSLVGFFWVAYNAIYGYYPVPGLSETYASVAVAAVSTVVLSMITGRKKGELHFVRTAPIKNKGNKSY